MASAACVQFSVLLEESGLGHGLAPKEACCDSRSGVDVPFEKYCLVLYLVLPRRGSRVASGDLLLGPVKWRGKGGGQTQGSVRPDVPREGWELVGRLGATPPPFFPFPSPGRLSSADTERAVNGGYSANGRSCFSSGRTWRWEGLRACNASLFAFFFEDQHVLFARNSRVIESR
ncbi:hypothetical protein F5X68DRAFT_200281, partial [Plectosphaerella plurivora]